MQHVVKRSLLFSGIVALVAILTIALLVFKSANATFAAHPQRACGSWSVVSSPNVGAGNNVLAGVAAISATNVWAVGSTSVISGTATVTTTLTEHWNGTAWSVVSSPNVSGSTTTTLASVAALGASDVWAVGSYYSNNAYHALIEQWNGSKWHIVSAANDGTHTDSLNGVAAISGKDVWAVGIRASNSGANQTLTEHWNGTAWSIIPTPNGGSGDARLYGVTAITTNNVWAVGTYNVNGVIKTLFEHWNGTLWKLVAGVSPGLTGSFLNGAAATTSSNVWAVGDYSNSVGPSAENFTLIEHWNGTAWSQVASPNPGTSQILNAVTALSTKNAWAVGDYRTGIDPNGPYISLIEHWNGTTWSIVSSPNPSNSYDILYGVAGVSGTTATWTAGFYEHAALNLTLTEAYC